MDHYFGKHFKQLRKTHDWTQEEVAEMLHVSPQAVGKWETGKSLPDISLLPIIANLFCVSVDRLLGVDIGKREEEIHRILEEAEELCEKERYADAVAFLRSALVQYPAEPRIMYALSWNLTGTIRENPQNLSEAIDLLERILEICEDPKLRAIATRDLMYRYYTADNEPRALEIAETIPDFNVCKEYNLGRSNLLYHKELSEYLQNNIRLYGYAMRECLDYFLDNVILSEEDMAPYTVEIAKHKMDLLDQILEFDPNRQKMSVESLGISHIEYNSQKRIMPARFTK